MWGMTEASTIKMSGVAIDVVSSIYKSYQIVDYAGEQAEEIKRAAAANAKLAERDASIALKAASNLRKKVERDVSIKYEQLDRLIGAQKAGFANVGVVVSTGSASHVQSETARLGKIDAGIIFHNGMTEVDRAKDLAKRYMLVSANKLQEGWSSAYMIEKSAGIAASNAIFEGASKAVKSTYGVGVEEGWWGAPEETPYIGVGSSDRKAQPSNKTRWKTWH